MSTPVVASDPRYPIGKFHYDGPFTQAQIAGMIQVIAEAPQQLRAALARLNNTQLDTPYRDGGWTVRQTVHHFADSHMNSFIRFRLALTEDKPTIKPYDEKLWAELPDSKEPVEVSLKLVEALHHRWVAMMKAFKPEDWQRTMVHPDRGEISCEFNLAIYAWHCKHHVAHITELRKRKGW
ncbi:MAG TPA: bacillithiol transferase BstA [Terriglobales bacterium]|nr:bacillithiol transferase BstA [Terriglobales bacterium]